MIRDLDDESDDSVVSTDVCIVGAGAAGITIAKGLAGSGLRVAVLESGGLGAERATQDLYLAQNAGLPRLPFDATRLRLFGGTTNHWTGICGLLEERDLRPRPWVPHSGWPISYDELVLYYPRALGVVGLDESRIALDHEEAIGRKLPEIAPERLPSVLLHQSPALRFGEHYRDELRSDADCEVVLHANATHIQLDSQARHVEKIAFRTLGGVSGHARARAYVLCCGGLENARLLLLSRDIERGGVGNRHDTVGRFLMDHPFVRTAEIIQTSDVRLDELYVDFERHEKRYRPALTLSEEEERRHQLTRAAAYLWRSDDHRSDSTRAARRVWDAFLSGRIPEDFAHDATAIASDLAGLFGDLRRDDSEATKRPRLELMGLLEQTPNRESRIELGAERDALGLPSMVVQWQLTDRDRRTLLRLAENVAAEFARLGLGRVRLEHWLAEHEGWPTQPMDYNHPMGTTRMSQDAVDGVVDSNARVHGIDNLYVAGSSIFPTAGVVNPTLTIVALSLRLADHLRTSLV